MPLHTKKHRIYWASKNKKKKPKLTSVNNQPIQWLRPVVWQGRLRWSLVCSNARVVQSFCTPTHARAWPRRCEHVHMRTDYLAPACGVPRIPILWRDTVVGARRAVNVSGAWTWRAPTLCDDRRREWVEGHAVFIFLESCAR